MELKTKITAEENQQEIHIIREFDLPVDLLFKAYTQADIVAQWMGTHVAKLENRQHGGYRFETKDPMGNIHIFHGSIHDLKENAHITRTFEMENTPFPPQIEYIDFEEITPSTSRIKIQVVYKSIALRDQMLKLPFAQGLNMAHNRLQEIMNQIN